VIVSTYHLHYVEGRGDESSEGASKRKTYDAELTRADLLDRVERIKSAHQARLLHSVSVHHVVMGERINMTSEFFDGPMRPWSSVPANRLLNRPGTASERKART
jgi:hypothetical protein